MVEVVDVVPVVEVVDVVVVEVDDVVLVVEVLLQAPSNIVRISAVETTTSKIRFRIFLLLLPFLSATTFRRNNVWYILFTNVIIVKGSRFRFFFG